MKPTITILSLLLAAASATYAHGEDPTEEITKDPAVIYAEAESYVSDPKWSGSANDTSWTIKKKKCVEGNFFKMGFNRSFSGRKRERGLEKIQKKCKKVDVVVDETAYFAGYDKGRLAYCGFSKGLRYGRRGTYPGNTICAPKTLKNFYKGFDIGDSQRSVIREHEAAEERLEFRIERLKALRYDIDNGTNTAELTGSKIEWLNKWEAEEKSLRRKLVSLEKTNPDVFNPEKILEQNKHFAPLHWRDQP